MKWIRRYGTSVIAAFCLVIAIFESQIVQDGAREGIELLLKSVIPALFPFMLITTYLNDYMIGIKLPGLQVLGSWCKIPVGAEVVFLLGLITGYPIGAKMVHDLYTAKKLDPATAKRMLGFCSNAGPAFIIGILGRSFSYASIPFIIWGIHIISAILVGVILPGKQNKSCYIPKTSNKRFSQMIEQCLKTMAIISAWIIIWRIIVAVCSKYFLLKIPACPRIIIIGLCELTNGCLLLHVIESEAIRFIVASCLISLGGLCIFMQTATVTKALGTGMYLPGKLLQVAISFALSLLSSYVLYPGALSFHYLFVLPVLGLVTYALSSIIRKNEKIMVAFQ